MRPAVMWWRRGGQRVSDRTGEGVDGLRPPTHPPHLLCDQGSQSQTSRVGRGAMNAGLCPVCGHHIPLEPLCGAQQSGGEGKPGQDRARQRRGKGPERKHRPESLPVIQSCNMKTLSDTKINVVLCLLCRGGNNSLR